MKKFLAILLVAFMLSPVMVFAEDDLEKLKADYQAVVNTFSQNLQSQQLLVEGFKATNLTFRTLVSSQQKLQQQAKALADKIKALETPEPEKVEE